MKTTDSKGLLGGRVYLQVFSAYSLLMLGVFIDMLAIMTIVGFEWEVRSYYDWIDSCCICTSWNYFWLMGRRYCRSF